MGFRTRRGFTLIEMMIVVAILGLLASIAIPAFTKYVRRSKTTEAVMNLRKMFDGSVAYYERDYSDRQGSILVNQFPGVDMDVPATPDNNPCCGQRGDKCAPDADAWDHAVWQGLSFGVDDPHYYWYHYAAFGVGFESAFTARAMGNLNCNDAFSTFERVGGVTADGLLMGGGGIFMIRPLE